jgi:N-acetyl-beta-hexosaminidase
LHNNTPPYENYIRLCGQIQDDAAGKSIGLIKQLLREMSTLFPDSVLHIGGDETGSNAPCDLADTKSFEVKLIDFVSKDLGKEVMG